MHLSILINLRNYGQLIRKSTEMRKLQEILGRLLRSGGKHVFVECEAVLLRKQCRSAVTLQRQFLLEEMS